MSADNSTFVATFPDGTIRVAYGYMSVVDELDSHFYAPGESKDTIKAIFGGSLVYTDRDAALLAAHALEQDKGATEYGVSEVSFLANFGEEREAIPEPELPDGACPHCSHVGGTISFHQGECEDDPSTPSYMVRMMLREKFYGVNEYIVTREVMEVLNEHFNIEPKSAPLTVVR